jgi:HEAT repeat protein
VRDPNAFIAIKAQILDESNRAGLPEFLRAIVAIDPEQGALVVAPFLAHRESRVRSAAKGALPASLPRVIVPEVVKHASSPRAPVRALALELLAGLGADAPIDEFFAALSDPEASVSNLAVQFLGASALPEVPERLLQVATESAPRPSLHAVLALVHQEDLRGAVWLSDQGPLKDRLVKHVRSEEPFYRGGAAIALSNMSYRSEDSYLRRLANEYLVPILIETVAGGSFFSDYATLEAYAWRKLELLTGAGLGARAQAWTRFWIDNQQGFLARRSLRGIAAEEFASAVVSYAHTSPGGGRQDVAVTGAMTLIGDQRSCLLMPEWEWQALATLIKNADLFATTGDTEAADPSVATWTFEVSIPSNAMNFRRSHHGVLPPELEPLRDHLLALGDRLTWQMLAPARGPSVRMGWMKEQEEWFSANRDPEAVRSRTLRLAVDGFADLDGTGRRAALELLGRSPQSWMTEHAPSVARALESMTVFTAEVDQLARRLISTDNEECLGAVLRLAGSSPSQRAALFLEDSLKVMPLDRLLPLRQHESHRVRSQVAHALKEHGSDSRVPEALLSLLEDSDPLVRGAALRSMAALKDPRVLGLLEGVLGSGDPVLRLRGIEALAAVTGEQGVPRLLDLYRAGDARERWAVIQALPRAGGSAAVKALASLTRETGATHSVDALAALLSMEDPEVTAALQSILERAPSTDLRGMAMEGLVSREGPAAIPMLLPYLSPESPPVLSRLALLSLARLGSTQSIPGLIQAMSKPDGDEAAERAFADLTFFESESPSPPLRAEESAEWLKVYSSRTRDEWFLLGAERSGVRMDAEFPWLRRGKLDSKQTRSAFELLQLGNRPLRQEADRILRAHTGLDLPPLGDNREEGKERVELYRLALAAPETGR